MICICKAFSIRFCASRWMRHVVACLLIAFFSTSIFANDLSLRFSIDKTKTSTNATKLAPTDIWTVIRNNYAIPDIGGEKVNRELNSYAANIPALLRTAERAKPYLFHITRELKIRGMPIEIALLPIIESAFNPHAKSYVKASGIWQFMPQTGNYFKLSQSTFKDDRKNILAATDAALNYLQKLHNMLGDWQLALAAYNCGEGRVIRAMKKNKHRNKTSTFQNISRYLPAETKKYVPKFQAVKNIVSHPEKYGVTLPVVPNQPYFASIIQKRDIDVSLAARLAEISPEDFVHLNPQFGEYLVTGSNDTQILLPRKHIDIFKHNLSQRKSNRALSSWTAYKVKNHREKLKAIATQYGTQAHIIQKANKIPPKMVLQSGSIILVPKTGTSPKDDISEDIINTAEVSWESEIPKTKRIVMKIKPNDCLSTIARRYNVKVSQIKKWNKLKNSRIRAGKRLVLYVKYEHTRRT